MAALLAVVLATSVVHPPSKRDVTHLLVRFHEPTSPDERARVFSFFPSLNSFNQVETTQLFKLVSLHLK